VSIEALPPLARLAAIAALVDFVWNRIAVRVMAVVAHETGVTWQRMGVFPRNLAAVSGLIALTASIYSFLRMAGYGGLVRRLSVSAISGLLLPAFSLALFLPKERVSLLVVIVSLSAANALACLVGLGALPYPSGPSRWASAFATASAVLVMSVLVIGTVPTFATQSWALPVGIACHRAGELAWHAVPLVVALAVSRTRDGAPRSEGPSPAPWLLLAAAAVTFTTVGLAVYGQVELHSRAFRTLTYAALRVQSLPRWLGWLYSVPVGVGLGAAVIGLCSPSSPRAQMGAAAALWLAAGYAPRNPGQLIDLALAAMLLARAAQASSVAGRERARLPWAPAPERGGAALREPPRPPQE
jgi:hypothetical protein